MADAFLALISPVADGGVAHFLETRIPFTSGKLFSWRTDRVEKAFVDFEGSFSGHDGLFGGKLTVAETVTLGSNVVLNRDADDILAQRRGTNPQIKRIYGKFTDAGNYERLAIATSVGTTSILQEQAGTGTAQGLLIGTRGSASLFLTTNNVVRWNIDASGNILAQTDNALDIGASGASRPRDFFLGRNAFIDGGLQVTGKTAIGGAANIHEGVTPSLEVTTSSLPSRLSGLSFFGDNGEGPIFVLAKSRGATAGLLVFPEPGDSLGRIDWEGADPAAPRFNVGARINATVGSLWTATNRETSLEFSVVASGATALGVALTIQSDSGVKLARYLEMPEIAPRPPAPAANSGRLFMEDNGSGKTRLVVTFPTGGSQQIAVES